MRCATTDKKLLNNLNAVIKESNNKIDELNQELIDLNSYIVITQSEPSIVLDTINTFSKKYKSLHVFIDFYQFDRLIFF